uniref:TPR_REGION domain-containing protein n=1 Tax=Panagrellus redivivus TaxID=6233 RepID=A0A7E4UU64_PANRE
MALQINLNGPLIHPKIKSMLDESKLDLSDVQETPKSFINLEEKIENLTENQKLALVELCLERVSLAVFAGCIKVENWKIDAEHAVVKEFQLTPTDFGVLQSTIDEADSCFDADPLGVLVKLRRGVIDVHPLSYYVQYFLVAVIATFPTSPYPDSNPKLLLAYAKLLYVYASIQVDPCLVVKQKLEQLHELSSETVTNLPLEAKIEFRLILANAFLMFFDVQRALDSSIAANSLCGIDVQFTGELGKRTYFQVNDLPQLFANANLRESSTPSTFTTLPPAADTPQALRLDDDTVMPEVKKTAGNDANKVELYPVHLACMVTSLVVMQRNEAPDEILFEKLEAFIQEVLSYRQVYGVQLRALLARCLVESDRKRKVERAVMQAEVLKNDLLGVHTVEGRNEELSTSQYRARYPWLLASNAKPFWSYLRSYATLLLKLGSVGEAMHAYNSIYDYDALVECYISLGQADKAETMVRNLLAVKETSYRLCLMGDITANPAWYEKAITKSHDNSAKARTALGRMLLKRGDNEGAFENLQRAVQIKPLETKSLFSLGHVAYKLERYAEAVAAYRNCVNVEPQDYESWNNLSASFVHLKRPEQAQRTMKEALKFNRNHTEMWRNYAIMSINVADYAQAIQAINEYLERARKPDVAEIVQELLLNIIQVRTEAGFNVLLKEAVAMMGHFSAKCLLDADTLCCYALLKKPVEGSTDVVAYESYLATASKAVQKCISSSPWKTDSDALYKTLQQAVDMVIAERALNGILTDGKKVQVHLSRITSILNTAQENFDLDDVPNKEQLKPLIELADSLISE